MKYNWQLPDWKAFSFTSEQLVPELMAFSEKIGLSKGLAQRLKSEEESSMLIEIVGLEAINSSAIEGEFFSREDVMSSIHKNLGISHKQARNRKAQGITDLILNIRQDYRKSLSKEDLYNWHKLVFPVKTGVNVGSWRQSDSPMQVISGSIGKEIIHFEAPPSDQVDLEMSDFIEWFNETGPAGDKRIDHAVIRSAIAHLYFESIHPFEDGNGRIGRAISEKALFQSLGSPALLSLSTILESNKEEYYQQLKAAQRTNQITSWIKYFISIVNKGLDHAQDIIQLTFFKSKLFDSLEDELNERQRKVLDKMLALPNKKFEGGMTAKKYMRINRTSKATATRDLQKLHELNVLTVEGAGRNTSYQVNYDSVSTIRKNHP